MHLLLLDTNLSILLRLGLILLAALTAHIAVVFVRASSTFILGSRLGSIAKARTFTRFTTSVLGFVIWFVAVGFALVELGVPLHTYLASATIIGLAVSFGSQSLVQDVIAGLTLIFTGLLDVGDMVEIGGQTGTIDKIGIRYTQLRNVQGAAVFIPNRNITNVISYRLGYIRAYLDVQLPADQSLHEQAAQRLESIAATAARQFSGIMIHPPSLALRHETPEGDHPPTPFVRIKFRIWPGQGGMIEGPVRQRVIAGMRQIDPGYADWMTAIHYRVEPAARPRAVSAMDIFRRRAAAQRNRRS